VIAWGNDARGDDALGPLVLAALQERTARAPWATDVDWRLEHQLQIELVELLRDCAAALFVDASRTAGAPFTVRELEPAQSRGVFTHSLPPDVLLGVYREVYGVAPPPATLLAVRGECFDLGAPMTDGARQHLEAAVAWGLGWMERTADVGVRATADPG
jgi:hydrogenase maturation protease